MKIIDQKGFTPKIGNLVNLLMISQIRIINFVGPLSKNQLDYYLDDKANSVGTLLKHMMALEDQFRILTFKQRELNAKEKKYWFGALEGQLIHRLIKGNSIDYYISLWEKVRAKTIKEFKAKTDDWLFADVQEKYNNYYLWFHVMEDQLCHFGQIKVLIKRLKDQGIR